MTDAGLDHSVAIFLSTYNGAQYLAEQLDSLLAQSHQNFCVYCRDDGSSDNTREIYQSYVDQHSSHFRWLQGSDENLKPCASFASLMEQFIAQKLSADYFMFCDQDDVWLENKILESLSAIATCTKEDQQKPLLIHTELLVVDRNLKTIAPSLSRYQGLKPGHGRFGRALINSSVTGCTMMFNRALLECALPVPQGAVMHDWWMAVLAQGFGKVQFLDKPLIQYRQHGGNTLGAKAQSGHAINLQFLRKLYTWVSKSYDLSYVSAQSQALLDQHGQNLSPYQKTIAKLSLLLDTPIAPMQKLLYRLIRQL
ncbi:glycosyltransferase family 2 protein [Pseudoteredinibacter isoporae]|uniref:Glycosyltransferase involved in cell wall biosynthesis n=1 Tax=Pseudoteredinibacter isoporae TaxID=570281 RepID=A0A7X0JVP4_9GAMM|nr:glycosyltransferase family 2 protein [Pseudoteredinibacter isoporae]MBB6523122.1 glycosyltransferase involved in cell wall biosynthesis [Pseudoteredinibacter isoporae]NHO88642.1 glycosyltransferase family 2 protein [Pseudoteredinibacter isoporae]NIB22667.1 glycosyltransferase family 2 protein [Pseudoteredinibacter isoporae]